MFLNAPFRPLDGQAPIQPLIGSPFNALSDQIQSGLGA
jgi:hypothetical protein